MERQFYYTNCLMNEKQRQDIDSSFSEQNDFVFKTEENKNNNTQVFNFI